jgi:TATA-binding related factor (TRF) of subunit 20 of Mediator complex
VGTSAADSTTQANESPNGSAAKLRSSTAEYSLGTIPSQLDTLFPLLMQKMSPLWVARQAHRVDGGTSFLIGDWKVRLGELRISGGQGQGRVRGCVCEVEFLFGDDGEEEEEDPEEIEGLARAFFEGLTHGSDVDLAGMKVVGTAPGRENRLVRQYMELFKFART